MKRLLKKFRQVGSINKRHGSGQPRNVFLEENMDLIGELVCSQEERPRTYLAPRKIDEQTGISQSSIQRMMKKINVKRFKRLKTPQMSEGIWNRREPRVGSFRERFESNIRMIKKKQFGKMKKISLLKLLQICRKIVYMIKKRNQISLMKIYLVWQTRCPKQSWHQLRFHGLV